MRFSLALSLYTCLCILWVAAMYGDADSGFYAPSDSHLASCEDDLELVHAGGDYEYATQEVRQYVSV
jgi:hypothetical protein